MVKYRPLEERFWEKVIKGPNCWTWLGSHQSTGYGMFRLPRHGTWTHAHRVAYELKNGPIASPSVFVCHSCDNPGCVRPDHLFLGTHKENMKDMVNKHRSRGHRYRDGAQHEMAKLTWPQVFEIRRLYQKGQYTQNQLGKKFGLTQTGIGRIIRFVAWREGIAG